ncbi:hypothetical protein B0H14DRAFT_2621914 [Mycena olivaceomarginata]|nr:hypothetical protein B0H14DRAFT_2621914 [Mycena olivaceomarginata]
MCRDGGYIHPRFAYLPAPAALPAPQTKHRWRRDSMDPFSLRTSAPTSPVLLSQHWTKGEVATAVYTRVPRLALRAPRESKGWHDARDDDPHGTHTATHIRTSSRTPRSRATSRQGGTDRRSAKTKMKENKMMPPWKGPLPETVVYISCLCWRCWQSQCMGLKQGVSIVDEKRKEEKVKWKNEARRLPEGSRVERQIRKRRAECYKSNSKSATQATRIEKRGSLPVPPERSKRKKNDVTRDRLLGPASNISLLLCHLVPCVEDEITDAKKAKKDEEE